MNLSFSKMHGLGNDFMVIDGINQQFELDREQIRALGNRHTGVGFDQLLIVAPSSRQDCDFLYRIYNCDGDAVEHCGNGARCITQFVRDQKLSQQNHFRFELINSQVIETELQDNGLVRVDMGEPVFEPGQIPFDTPAQSDSYMLRLDEAREMEISAVSMGNPHAVLLVDDTDAAPVSTLGPLIEHHQAFPNRVNVGFMQIITPDTIRLRVFERGAGETLACGTGACAAVAAGRIRNLLSGDVTVQLNGGTLNISWAGRGHPLFMTGPATMVYEGQVNI